MANNKMFRYKRNDALMDIWSFVHMGTGVLMGWLIDPFIALTLMVLWEPLEIFVLSPILAKAKIEFGFETLQNSLSDIVFDTAGIMIGYYLLRQLIEPPFLLF